MEDLQQQAVACPYCGETIQVLLDFEDSGQQYIEDCQVCCRPITFVLTRDWEGDVRVDVYDENAVV